MNRDFFEARKYIAEAREALQRGDKESAWQLGKQAASIAPQMEDVWLVLTASDPNPQQALAYAEKALKINPKSTRARRGMEWARTQVKQKEAGNVIVRQAIAVGLPQRVSTGTIQTPLNTSGRKQFYLALLLGAGCLMVGFMAFFAWTNPALASFVSNAGAPAAKQENLWAPVDIAKPTITPIDVSAFAPQLEDVARSALSDAPTPLPTDTPTLAVEEMFLATPTATETPGTMVMEIVDNTPTSQPVSSDKVQAQYPAAGNGERWIDVNLSEQRVYVYEGDVLVNSFLVSTGLPATPTVTGKYRIYVKVRMQDMSGPGYYLRDVPWVMFFYEDYGFHGTYWHNNFGTPMSRGCVNLTIDDAAWLFNWASVGTLVNIHY